MSDLCLIDPMLTVNDAGGTHNTQLTTAKNDLIHTCNTQYVLVPRIDFDTSDAMRIRKSSKWCIYVGIPTSDSLKSVTKPTTVKMQYFAKFLREVRWNSRRTSFIPRSVVLLFLEFGAEPPHASQGLTRPKSKEHTGHTQLATGAHKHPSKRSLPTSM